MEQLTNRAFGLGKKKMETLKRTLALIFILCGFTSCIEFYHPDLENTEPKYVVDGEITDQEGYQTVTLSMTSDIDVAKFVTLPHCTVKITDNLGNIFNLAEVLPGIYKVWMGKEYLVPGRSYQVNIKTPSGIEIVSDFDQMNECPSIDSVYYQRNDLSSSSSGGTKVQSIQFYLNFKQNEKSNNYYRWRVVETWEHHSVYPITWYSGGKLSYTPANYSKFTCWTTSELKDIFTFSSKSNSQLNVNRLPIQLVDNQNQKLTYGYSALVNQCSLSESAYNYWNQLRINSDELDGVFSSQPIHVKGNLRSTSNPELDILGFFSASSIKTKRIFVQNVKDFNTYQPNCINPRLPTPLDKDFNGYMMEIEGRKYIIEDACVECDYMDGTTVKPSFWPW